jgi:hypothetical protein
MSKHSFIAAGLGLALALFASAGLKISAAPALSVSVSASESALQGTNRMRKSDRLPLMRSPGSHQNDLRDTVVIPELLDGCEPVISSIVDSPLARVAGSCLS